MLRQTWQTLRKVNILAKIVGSFLALTIYCEFVIYYVILSQCSWPSTFPKIPPNDTLKAMFLADTHLLGPINGHWFDKARREWQMHRAFQTAQTIFAPEVVFFLGDIFDEGLWVNFMDFEKYVKRFHSLFGVSANTKMYIIVGNHDIGFHYKITPELDRRFRKAFNTSSVQTVRLKGNTFILINSMAMERDGCFLCQTAVTELFRISRRLRCDKNPQGMGCNKLNYLPREYTQPILLQHFPLYRDSDKTCTGPDSASDSEKQERFYEKWDCLSRLATKLVLDELNPRLVMSGHTHNHCIYFHNNTPNDAAVPTIVPEYSVPSFSWRNRNDPSFYLGIFTKSDYNLEKCAMPSENTVIELYKWGSVLIVYYFIIRPFLPSIQVVFILFQRVICKNRTRKTLVR